MFAPENSPIPQDQAINSIDFLNLEKEARKPQLVPRFHEAIDGCNELAKFILGQAIQVTNNSIQVAPQRINK
jgi:hypothetical protein